MYVHHIPIRVLPHKIYHLNLLRPLPSFVKAIHLLSLFAIHKLKSTNFKCTAHVHIISLPFARIPAFACLMRQMYLVSMSTAPTCTPSFSGNISLHYLITYFMLKGRIYNRYLAPPPSPPQEVNSCPDLENHYRPYMCYIFGKPWVQGTLWQCYGVSDMQIQKTKTNTLGPNTIQTSVARTRGHAVRVWPPAP